MDFRFQQNLRVPSDSHRSGEITFSPTTTEGPNGGGLALASFLLGDVGSFTRYVSNSTNAAERQNRLFTYIQDTWRITPKLTLNYGLALGNLFPAIRERQGQRRIPEPGDRRSPDRRRKRHRLEWQRQHGFDSLCAAPGSLLTSSIRRP